jgi:hypothetical protein
MAVLKTNSPMPNESRWTLARMTGTAKAIQLLAFASFSESQTAYADF